MLSAKKALRWILQKLKLLLSSIELLKLDNYNPSWGFVITFANSSMDICFSGIIDISYMEQDELHLNFIVNELLKKLNFL